VHYLLFIEDPKGLASRDLCDPEQFKDVRDFVDRTITAWLPPCRDEDEETRERQNDPLFNMGKEEKDAFAEGDQPSRQEVRTHDEATGAYLRYGLIWPEEGGDATHGYELMYSDDDLDEDGAIRKVRFQSKQVEEDFRRLILENNMHTCFENGTCFKHGCSCRFFYPFAVNLVPETKVFTGMAYLLSRYDNRSRKRLYVYPRRNNANLAKLAVSPAIMCTWRGNMDHRRGNERIFYFSFYFPLASARSCGAFRSRPHRPPALRSFVTQKNGAATYACSYASKPEAPDESIVYKLLGKTLGRIAGQPSTRDVYRTLLNSTLSATKARAASS